MGWLRREFGLYSGDSCCVRPVTNKSVRLAVRAHCIQFYVECRAMAQSESIFDPTRLVLHHPICPRCGVRMWLATIEPDSPDHDKRTFECPQCENVVSEIFKYR
jgi:hypothetical protein